VYKIQLIHLPVEVCITVAERRHISHLFRSERITLTPCNNTVFFRIQQFWLILVKLFQSWFALHYKFQQDILTGHHQRETISLDPHICQQIQEHNKLHKQIKYSHSDKSNILHLEWLYFRFTFIYLQDAFILSAYSIYFMFCWTKGATGTFCSYNTKVQLFPKYEFLHFHMLILPAPLSLGMKVHGNM